MVAIGSSVFEDDPTTFWEHHHHQQQHSAPSTRSISSLLQHHKRILLQGPAESSKSSLSMDLALSIASKEPCRCRMTGRPSSSGSRNSEYSDCQNCAAVTIITTSNNEQEEDFPLLCRSCVSDSTDSSATQSKLQDAFQPDDVQQQAMQRIQVRHTTNMEDVLQYLLSLTGLPIEQHPTGGIIVENLDRFVTQHQDAAVATIRMTQIVAVLVDTACCLKRLYGRSPVLMVTTTTAGTNVVPNPHSHMTPSQLFLSASTFWSPRVLDVLPADGNNASQKHDNDEVAIGHWIVKFKKESVAEYSILQNLDHEQRIVYSTKAK